MRLSGTSLHIRERPPAWLAEYATISIAFETNERMRVVQADGGIELIPEPRAGSFSKNYDLVGSEHPDAWARFDLATWQLFGAYDGDAFVGAATVAMRTPDLNLLEGRDDVALLFDIRVMPERRGQGVGTALLRAAEAWAVQHGAHAMKIETQNTNPDACRFYAGQGYAIHSFDPNAYPSLPDETQLIWVKPLESNQPP
jgi:GNAT superfamily N-acetyltransferase